MTLGVPELDVEIARRAIAARRELDDDPTNHRSAVRAHREDVHCGDEARRLDEHELVAGEEGPAVAVEAATGFGAGALDDLHRRTHGRTQADPHHAEEQVEPAENLVQSGDARLKIADAVNYRQREHQPGQQHHMKIAKKFCHVISPDEEARTTGQILLMSCTLAKVNGGATHKERCTAQQPTGG